MGGFLYTVREPEEAIDAVKQRLTRSLAAMSDKGLTLLKEVSSDDCAIFVFAKTRFKPESFIEFENGDFIVATGTLFYERRHGVEALRKLFEDFDDPSSLFTRLAGHYAVLINKGGRSYIFNDYNGIYHIYADSAEQVLSSSFLAVYKSLASKTPAAQEIYEYVSHGMTYGGKTLIEEIHLLDSDAVYQVKPERKRVAKKIDYEPLPHSMSFDEQVRTVAEEFDSYFQMLRQHFGDSMSIALSGGYDTRHLVGVLQRTGVSPYLYVYGGDRTGDVRVAKRIADGEHFHLHHENRENQPRVECDEFSDIVRQQFHIHDGRGLFGAFGNGSDAQSRDARTESSRLQLNGSGGEIFRNFWKMPDTSIDIMTFVKARYDWVDWSVYTGRYDKRRYFATMAEKVKSSIDASGKRINCLQREMIYWRFRLRYWMAPSLTANNLTTYALAPYAEPRFTIPSMGIRLKHKNYGRFQSALISAASPKLAQYTSLYGHNFQDPMPWRNRCKADLMMYLPARLKPIIWKQKLKRSAPNSMPYFLSQAYVQTVLGEQTPEISRYVHLDRLYDPEMLNRALTVQLVLTDRF